MIRLGQTEQVCRLFIGRMSSEELNFLQTKEVQRFVFFLLLRTDL